MLSSSSEIVGLQVLGIDVGVVDTYMRVRGCIYSIAQGCIMLLSHSMSEYQMGCFAFLWLLNVPPQ